MQTTKKTTNGLYLGNGQETLYCAENLYGFSAIQLYSAGSFEAFLERYRAINQENLFGSGTHSSSPLHKRPSYSSGPLAKPTVSLDMFRLSGISVGSGPSRSAFETDLGKKKLEKRLDAGSSELFRYKSPYQMDRSLSPFISGAGLRSFLPPISYRTSGPI